MQKPSDIHEAAEAIYRLQRGATTRGEEAEIRAILLGFRGAELTRLKNLIGDRTDRHDLEGLLYYDIDDESVRAEILAHFAAVAAKEASDEVKVLCDIDDTLVCRLHDDRYPRGTVYPGAVAFLEALDQGPRDAPFSTGDLTFITARPADAFGLIETYSRGALRRAGVADLDLIGGTFGALLSHESMADRKVLNIKHYRELFPEYRVMFVGDSGQGDPLVGERIRAAYDDIAAVLIHDVVQSAAEHRERMAAKGLVYFDSYAGAALAARDLGLMSERGLATVIDRSRTELRDVAWESGEQRDATTLIVARDIAAAEAKYRPTPDAPRPDAPAPERRGPADRG